MTAQTYRTVSLYHWAWSWSGLAVLLASHVCLLYITHLTLLYRRKGTITQTARTLYTILDVPSCSSVCKKVKLWANIMLSRIWFSPAEQQSQQREKCTMPTSSKTDNNSSALVEASSKSRAGADAHKDAPSLPTAAQVAQLIKQRRSIFPKHMNGEAVNPEHISALLEAANWAPTHGRTEPWRFVVLGKQGVRDMQDVTNNVYHRMWQHDSAQLQEVLADLQHDRMHRWHTVSHMIAICMARQAKPNKLMPVWEELAACSCAVQNMHLMATALGLAAYWSSWHDLARDSPEMLEFLGLNFAAGDRCWGFLVLGMADPAVVQAYRSSRGAIQEKVTYRG